MSLEPTLSESDYELLSAYIDGMLTAGERAALEARLRDEPLLVRELAALRQTLSLLQRMPRLKAPRDFTLTPDVVAQDTPAARRGRSLIPFPLVSALSAAAAVILIVFGAGLLFSETMRQPRSLDQQLAAAATPVSRTAQPEVEPESTPHADDTAQSLAPPTATWPIDAVVTEEVLAFSAEADAVGQQSAPAQPDIALTQAAVSAAEAAGAASPAMAGTPAPPSANMMAPAATPSPMPSPLPQPQAAATQTGRAGADITAMAAMATATLPPTPVFTVTVSPGPAERQSTAASEPAADVAQVSPIDEAAPEDVQEAQSVQATSPTGEPATGRSETSSAVYGLAALAAGSGMAALAYFTWRRANRRRS